MTKALYSKFIHATNATGSNKAASYIRALDLLCEMLQEKPLGFGDCKNIWAVHSVERLQELYLLVSEEKGRGNDSVWNIQSIPKSYLQKGYCSAALKSYQKFLIENNYEQKLLRIFENYKGSESELPKMLEMDLNYPEFINEEIDDMQGKEQLRSVSVRLNQNVFRKMILKIYSQSCCITGLNIPEINRASHIIPWAEDVSKRLDPRNGLCLSATYDAAFDRNLISLDEDYRIIISRAITDHYTNKIVKEYFLNKKGSTISLPSSYFPHKDYLAAHRDKGEF